ncbi:hypothetical protein TUN199_04533 [Pyrenophora tritici-repentis]|nr:hypothetical protein Alg215_04586 [Pyrenophora tritici-repentis]KAI0623447.1 hypothetical protein TUN199_04533 [Pyrenophora tritici-repentis]
MLEPESNTTPPPLEFEFPVGAAAPFVGVASTRIASVAVPQVNE